MLQKIIVRVLNGQDYVFASVISEPFCNGDRSLLPGIIRIKADKNLFSFLKSNYPLGIEALSTYRSSNHIFETVLVKRKGIQLSLSNDYRGIAVYRSMIPKYAPAPKLAFKLPFGRW